MPHPLLAKGARLGHSPNENSRSNFPDSPHHAPFLKKGCGTRKTETAPFAHRQDCLCHANHRRPAPGLLPAIHTQAGLPVPRKPPLSKHGQDCLFYLNRPRGTGNPACVAAPAADAVAFLSQQRRPPLKSLRLAPPRTLPEERVRHPEKLNQATRTAALPSDRRAWPATPEASTLPRPPRRARARRRHT